MRNPQGVIEMYFNDTSAWELIAEELKAGCPVEEVSLNKPPGAKGYVLLIDLAPNQPQLYVKLQLGAGKIIGRSFHYSTHPRQGV